MLIQKHPAYSPFDLMLRKLCFNKIIREISHGSVRRVNVGLDADCFVRLHYCSVKSSEMHETITHSPISATKKKKKTSSMPHASKRKKKNKNLHEIQAKPSYYYHSNNIQPDLQVHPQIYYNYLYSPCSKVIQVELLS